MKNAQKANGTNSKKENKMLKSKHIVTILCMLLIFASITDAATKIWLGSTATIGYDSGSDEPTAGDTLTGTTSSASAVFLSATLGSGSWAGNDAAGVLTLRAVSGTFTEDEIIINSTTLDTDIATIDIAGSAFADGAGDFDVAANWSPSGVPATADDIVFNGLADDVPSDWDGASTQTSGKKFSVDAGFDQSAKNFASITVTSGYDGDIGSGLVASTYNGLRFACDDVIFAGTGDVHLIAQHASLPIDSVTNSSSSGSMFLGKGFTNGQEITEVIHAGSASTEILEASLSTLAAPEVDAITCTSRRGSVTIAEDNSSTVLSIRVALGTINAFCNVDSVEISGGTFNWGSGDFVPSSARTIDLLEILQGTMLWDMAGTISECKAFVGDFRLSGSGAKVIGDSTLNAGTIEVYDATIDFSNAENNISLATDAEVKILGQGTFLPPPFVDITWN